MRKMATVFGIMAVLSVASLLVNSGAVAGEKISAQQYVDLVIGNTQIGKSLKEVRWKIFVKEGGKMVFNMENGFYDEAAWQIVDGKFCQKWQKIYEGKKYCTYGYEMDGGLITYDHELQKDRQGPIRVIKGVASNYEDVK